MSRLFPHAAYAEDQPLGYTILTTHCLHRGFQSGAIVGVFITLSRASYQFVRGTVPAATIRSTFVPSLLRTVGVSSIWGTGLLAAGVLGRMWGREEIEWKDRSWRLLANEGQVECDDWSVAGTLAGLGAVVATGAGARRGRVPGAAVEATQRKAMQTIGTVGLGNVAGIMGYMTWRYGVNGKKTN